MDTELFIDARGLQVEVHERNDECLAFGCCIHNPSEHPLRGAPLVYQLPSPFDFRPPRMERICKHEVSHPDYDGVEYLRRSGNAELAYVITVHPCCGCCIGTTFA